MKKNSSIDFTIPQRQSYVAILLIIWRTYKIIFRQALPLILIVFLGQSDSKGNKILWGIIAVAIISMIYSIIAFFKFRFYINDDELVIEKGIFNKKTISIDIDRVQTINFEQNLLHKPFGVVRLKADTAGSGKEEFNLDAINHNIGYALRDIVLQIKEENTNNDGLSDEQNNIVKSTNDRTIFKLTFDELLLAGTVENHIRSSGIIIAFFFYIYSNLTDIGVDVEEYTEDISPAMFSFQVTLIFIVIIAIISFVISMIRMVITYYDLKLVRSGNGFNYTAGLFTKRTVSALDQKIQTISWSDNLLKKQLKIFDLKFEQAGSEEIKEKKSIKIPSAKIAHIKAVLYDLFPSFNIDHINLKRISIKWLYRQLIYRIVLALSVVIFGLYIEQNILFIGILLLVFLPLHAFLRYYKSFYGFDEHFFLIKGGIYGDKNRVFPIYKLQSITRKQTPYMRRNKLISLTFHHASGSSSIPFIPEIEALKILNYTLYKIEISTQKWM